MSTLLAGDQALRGRAALDLRVGPFRFRDAAAYWQCEPATAFLVDAVLGGAPGYRDIVGTAPTPGPDGFLAWLERTILNPSHALFTEPDYLLAEDPRIGDRATYHSIRGGCRHWCDDAHEDRRAGRHALDPLER